MPVTDTSLIIHSTRDPVVRGVDFDEEVVVMVQDWMSVWHYGYKGSG